MSIGTKSVVQPVKERESQALAILDAELVFVAARWQDHGRRGLELCREIGTMLNRSLGDPTERQPYGGKILAKVAATLETAQSELSRMRWFAYLFESVAAFHETHADLPTWTAFKKALPDLKGRKVPKDTTTSEKSAVAADLADAATFVAGITKRLAKIKDLGEDDLVQPLTNLRKKVKALCERLGLAVTELQN